MVSDVTTEKPVILAVDDSSEMLDILKNVIAGAGYRFFGASNANQCMRLVRDLAPDLILLDIQMPEVDGFDLCRQIRAVEACQRIPVAFVTARRTAQDVKAGIAAGGNDFITKPFDPRNLMARVERWVKQKQV